MDTKIPMRVRGAAAALVVKPTSRVLILKRDKPSSRGLWSLLMGEIEPGESASRAIRREIREELRVEGGDLFTAGCCDVFYNHKTDAIEFMPVFVLMLESPPTITLDAEHDDYSWSAFAQATDRIAYPGQRQALREIERDFIHRDPPDFRRVKV